jgi:transcriptional regulator with XRE-family HTH domain
MNYEHFGNLLRELRESRNLTREQLAQNICTPKQIYRIEKGYSEPSICLLNQLSIKLNIDLNEYFKMHFSNHSIIGFEGIKNINNAIEQNDIQKIKELVVKYESLEEFKHGENLQHILYGKSLCSALLDNNYNLSLKYCIEGLRIENPSFTIDTISQSTYSNVGLALINCISKNYLALHQTEIGIKVLHSLLYVLEQYIIYSPYPIYQATQFSKKIYQNTLYNLSFYFMNNGDIYRSLEYVNKGIEFSLKEYNLRFLPDLQLMKFKLLYRLENYEEAKDYYIRVIYLYKITNQEDKLKKLEDEVKIEYPVILL